MTMATYRQRVAEETGAEGDEEVTETIRATLDLLGERISREEAKNLAGGLPDEAETWVIDWDTHSERAFGVGEFVERLADRLDVESEEAHHRAQVVLGHLADEVGRMETAALTNQLPDEYQTFF